MNLDGGVVIAILVLLFIIFIIVFNSIEKIKSERDTAAKSLSEINIRFTQLSTEFEVGSERKAIERFEKYKAIELQNVTDEIKQAAINAAYLQLQQWKMDSEERIRRDAINRSAAVNLGKSTEHLIPFYANFRFNPRDARFIGSPIDLIVFDGITDEKDEVRLYFLEVKTGKSRLTHLQRKIKSAVEDKRIFWLEISPENL